MNIPRLVILRNALLAELPSNTKFDMDIWFEKDTCGTVCCAFGLAASLPAFQMEGLTLCDTDGCIAPRYEGDFGTMAAMRFFDISHLQAAFLFLPSQYRMPISQITPDLVARRINQLILEERLGKDLDL